MLDIQQKYQSLNGSNGILGPPKTQEFPVPDPRVYFLAKQQIFEHGAIFWHPEIGAFEVHGSIYAKYESLGGPMSYLGYPLTDETSTPDEQGRYNHFQHGSVYWHPNTGAFEVHGGIRAKWRDLGWERSYLGYPISDELSAGGTARFNRFQNGAIYWTPEHDAQDMVVERPHPTYLFSLDNFRITKTRSVDDDTVYVNFAFKESEDNEGNEQKQNLYLGNLDDGIHDVNLYFGPVTVPQNSEAKIVYSFQILNHGYGDFEAVKKALNKSATELSELATASENIWFKILGGLLPTVTNILTEILLANCDGPLAIDAFKVDGQKLHSLTVGDGICYHTQHYPGIPSPVGCGDNSEYYVTRSIIRL